MGGGEFTGAGLDRLRAILAGHVERGSGPGVAWLVSRRGETHAGAVGTTEYDGAGRSLERDAIFRISSMSKPVTAVATMILIEDCVLRLDDPVEQWLPELADRRVVRTLESPLDDTVPAHRPITVRDLLTFRLGFGGVFAPPGVYPIADAAQAAGVGVRVPSPAGTPGPDEFMKRLGELPLMYQPGERWLYHTGADVLGVLIARAAGMPFGDFLRERLFAPLGMVDTDFHVPAGKLDRFVPSYVSNLETGATDLYDPVDGQWASPPAFPGGGDGLVSTVDDFHAFGRMLLAGGAYDGGRLLSRPSVELMTTDHLTPEQKRISGMMPGDFENSGWGFGVSVVTRRDFHATVGCYGWDGGLGTAWHNDPTEDLTTILMCPQAWTSPKAPPLCLDFWTATYSALAD